MSLLGTLKTALETEQCIAVTYICEITLLYIFVSYKLLYLFASPKQWHHLTRGYKGTMKGLQLKSATASLLIKKYQCMKEEIKLTRFGERPRVDGCSQKVTIRGVL